MASLARFVSGFSHPSLQKQVAELTRQNEALQWRNQHDQRKLLYLEQALRASEDRFASLTDLSFDWFWEQDCNFRFLEVTGMVHRTEKFARQNVMGMTRWELDHQNMPEGVWEAHRQLLNRHEPFRDFEITLLDHNGRIRYESISGVPIFSASGEFTGYRGIGRDTTEMHRVTDALRASEAQLREITDTMPALIAFVDASQVVGFHNPAFEKALGVSGEQIHGKSLRAVIGDEMHEAIRPLILQLQSGLSVSFERSIHSGPGHEDYVFNCFPQFGEEIKKGEVTGFYMLGTNITERKRAERDIRRLNGELEERVRQRTLQLELANKELEAFSYSVSHDLRAPLNTVNGFSQLLEKRAGSVLDEKSTHYLDRMRAACRQMGELIEGLLALAKVSREPLTFSEVDLTALVEKLHRECTEREPGRRVELNVEKNMLVSGDPLLLSVVVQNLLSNAWKYSATVPEPAIQVGRTIQPDGEEVFFVKDNGVGFDMAYVDKLFGVFQRLHSPEDFAGTGIGLANVKRVIERHGGRVWAQGRPGEGADFYFTLASDG